jgi:hypothetical protein
MKRHGPRNFKQYNVYVWPENLYIYFPLGPANFELWDRNVVGEIRGNYIVWAILHTKEVKVAVMLYMHVK